MSRPRDADRELIRTDVSAWLARHEAKEMLRFITCGSVDDGKSTLIGRLLYDSKQIFDDQLDALEADSKRQGTQGEGNGLGLAIAEEIARVHHSHLQLQAGAGGRGLKVTLPLPG